MVILLHAGQLACMLNSVDLFKPLRSTRREYFAELDQKVAGCDQVKSTFRAAKC
jgi:hypothetical protein